MEKETKYMIISYTDKDLKYIDYLVENIDKIAEEIVNFFDINDFGEKIKVVLNDSLEAYREKYIETGFFLDKDGSVPKWSCGFSFQNKVETLCLEEYIKTRNSNTGNKEDLLYLILHEFTHACYKRVRRDKRRYKWLSEGLATTLSHQYDNSELIFNATLNNVCDGVVSDYRNYHTMFKYVLDTCPEEMKLFDNFGREYILKLIDDYDLLVQDTPKLYNEVREKYDKVKTK